ncbi:MAG: hypothetical protein WAV38_26650 [Xanthobacteraceae bacterium]
MTDLKPTTTITFKVGKYTCTMSYDEGATHLRAEWQPHLPPKGSLTAQEFEQYRAGRDALFKQVGGAVLVLEI